MSEAKSRVDEIKENIQFGLDLAKEIDFSIDSYAPGSSYSRIPTTFSMGRAFGARIIPDSEYDFLVKR